MPEKKSKNAASDESLQQALDALGAQVAELRARLEKLEAAGAETPAAAVTPAAGPVVEAAAAETAKAAPVEEAEGISEEVLLVLSAAVAAFLGKRPHIRAIRLHRTGAWAQQGRVFIQASHQLNIPHEHEA